MAREVLQNGSGQAGFAQVSRGHASKVAKRWNEAAIKTAAPIPCLKPNCKASVLPVVRVVDKALNSLTIHIPVAVMPAVRR
jgi:hypothetical protein